MVYWSLQVLVCLVDNNCIPYTERDVAEDLQNIQRVEQIH